MEKNVRPENSRTDEITAQADKSHFEAILSHMSQGVCLFDGAHRLVVCNQKYVDIYELPPQLAQPGTHIKDLLWGRIHHGNFPEMDPQDYIENRMQAVYDKQDRTEIHHMRNGRVIAVGHRPMQDGGWLTTHEDITELYALQKDIRHLAYHDPLTDLPNRVSLGEELDRALARSREGEAFALLFLDLDGFKQVNDVHGHSAGDQLLVAAARRLRNCVRTSDMVARLGGDEFAIVQSSRAIPDDAEALAQRIISELSKPFDFDGMKFEISTSIGISFAAGRVVSRDEILIEADSAMYEAKRAGGGRYTLYLEKLGTDLGITGRAPDRKDRPG